MEQLFSLITGLAGEVHSKLTEGTGVNLRKDYGRVYLGVFKKRNCLKGALGVRVICRRDRECHKHLVGVESWIMISKILGLKLLNRLDDLRGDNVYLIGNTRRRLNSVEKCSAGRAEKRACLACYNFSVVKLDGNSGSIRLLCLIKCRTYATSALLCRAGQLTQEKLDLVDFGIVSASLSLVSERVLVATNYLLLCRIANSCVVINTKSRHIYTHIGR